MKQKSNITQQISYSNNSSYAYLWIAECMGVREVKPIFHKNDESIGARDCMVLPTSGLTGDGVEEGIKWLVDCVKRNTPIRPPKGSEDDWSISLYQI